MGEAPETEVDPRKIFVVHGRNMAARQAMFDFLRALHLEPIEWSKAVLLTGEGSPYVGDVLAAAFKIPRAVIVLITGDEEVRLKPRLRHGSNPDENLTKLQPRPNVLFEAGMAFGLWPSRTILVQLGVSRDFSDITGRHIVHFSGDSASRNQLKQRLKTLGCAVDDVGNDWLTAGDFDKAIELTEDDSSSRPRKSGPTTYVVDSSGTSGYRTITDAIQVAYPGDLIQIHSGVYEESLVIDKPLDIAGVGERSAIRVQAKDGPTVSFRASGGRLATLTIRQLGGRYPCVEVLQGNPTLEEIDVSCKNGTGILVHEPAIPLVTNTDVHDSSVGVVISRGGQGIFESNDIHDNSNVGVVVDDGANPIFRKKNRIHDNGFTGFNIQGGKGLIEDNEIYSNHHLGVLISRKGTPRITNNRIQNNGEIGIVVNENGLGLIEHNEISLNKIAGIQISDNADPKIIDNLIEKNGVDGVFIAPAGKGSLEQNEIKTNGNFGINVHRGAEPKLSKNKIHSNAHAGVEVSGVGSAVLEENEIYQNAADCENCPEVRIQDAATAFLRRNIVHDGRVHGVVVVGATATLESKNQIFRNSQCGIHIGPSGRVTIIGNEIHRNGKAAIELTEGASGVIRNNKFMFNGQPSLLLSESQRKLVAISGNKEFSYNPNLKPKHRYRFWTSVIVLLIVVGIAILVWLLF